MTDSAAPASAVPAPDSTPSSRLTRCLHPFALALAATMTFIINIAPWVNRDLGSKGELFFSPFDLLAPVGCAVLLFISRRRVLEIVRRFPVALAAYLVLCALSFIAAVQTGDQGIRALIGPFGKKAVLNIGLFLVAGPLLWALLADGGRRLTPYALTALAAAGIVIVPAYIQYFRLAGIPAGTEIIDSAFPFDVGGLMENWNRLGMLLALVLPFALSSAASPCGSTTSDWIRRIGSGALFILGIGVLLKGGALAAAVIGCGLTIALLDENRDRALAAGLLAAGILFAALLPRNNIGTAIASVGSMRQHPTETDAYGNAVHLNGERARRLMRVGVAVTARPLTGYGVGQYDAHIIKRSTDYDPDAAYYKGSRQTHDRRWWGIETNEKNDFGLYEAVAVETGLPGVICLVLAFLAWIARGIKALPSIAPADRWLLIGAVGALASVAVAAVYLDPLTRGVGAWLSLAIGVIAASGASAESQPLSR